MTTALETFGGSILVRPCDEQLGKPFPPEDSETRNTYYFRYLFIYTQELAWLDHSSWIV